MLGNVRLDSRVNIFIEQNIKIHKLWTKDGDIITAARGAIYYTIAALTLLTRLI